MEARLNTEPQNFPLEDMLAKLAALPREEPCPQWVLAMCRRGDFDNCDPRLAEALPEKLAPSVIVLIRTTWATLPQPLKTEIEKLSHKQLEQDTKQAHIEFINQGLHHKLPPELAENFINQHLHIIEDIVYASTCSRMLRADPTRADLLYGINKVNQHTYYKEITAGLCAGEASIAEDNKMFGPTVQRNELLQTIHRTLVELAREQLQQKIRTQPQR